MTVKVFVDGGAGTTGIEIVDRLSQRGDVALTLLSDAHRKDSAARADALAAADIAILCLPDDAAREAVALAADWPTRFIDASTAHRTATGWTYGFAEIEPDRRAELAEARTVSNPGCYPTGFLALVRPLVRAGLLAATTPLVTHATSGYSGGGKAMVAEYENGTPPTAFRGYGLSLEHKHVPEMQRHAGLAVPPIFAPAVANTYRGMLVEVPLHLSQLSGGTTVAQVHAALADAYAGSPLVEVVSLADSAALSALTVEDVAGTDRLKLYVFANPRTGHLRLAATLDNLGKGASGAAVQNLNLMAGLPETEGLRL
ncbi:N-acetyl-gamma-glutamyl-phosphate reductase [Sphingomonas abietis]|uniref:N-acetyl-gamma-glutamyl-phosphate reductase n=1 Tax=Sphingomonas abietis TaxID=3012344 RepID=A0ABY7NHS3_9SPHN|nr:N-acetyl-gamma-glutamyl-phosphate reductase [Sphingomonas abietis]WBO21085.1 N-acetyl-gamma-glutamyl-phosphate reductase [Sphingomonas abietis]